MLEMMWRNYHTYIANNSVKWYNHPEKLFDNFLKSLTCNCHLAQQLHSWEFMPEKCL